MIRSLLTTAGLSLLATFARTATRSATRNLIRIGTVELVVLTDAADNLFWDIAIGVLLAVAVDFVIDSLLAFWRQRGTEAASLSSGLWWRRQDKNSNDPQEQIATLRGDQSASDEVDDWGGSQTSGMGVDDGAGLGEIPAASAGMTERERAGNRE